MTFQSLCQQGSVFDVPCCRSRRCWRRLWGCAAASPPDPRSSAAGSSPPPPPSSGSSHTQTHTQLQWAAPSTGRRQTCLETGEERLRPPIGGNCTTAPSSHNAFQWSPASLGLKIAVQSVRLHAPLNGWSSHMVVSKKKYICFSCFLLIRTEFKSYIIRKSIKNSQRLNINRKNTGTIVSVSLQTCKRQQK